MGKLYDVIIIGSGPAGMTAAIYCARKGLNTLIIGKEVGGQVAKSAGIENYLGFGSSTGTELTRSFHDHISKFKNIEHVHNVLVKGIKKNSAGFELKTDSGKSYQSKALIIASGRNPKELGIPGEKEYKNKGVSYCEVCDGPLFKGKNIAVIGGGNSGLQAALFLAKICPKVYILEFTSKLSADKVYSDALKKFKNVKIITNSQTVEFFGDKFLSGLRYRDLKDKKIKQISVSGAFIEIGWIPSIDFDKLTKKNRKQEIMIDKHCQTSVPGIFAAGDITDIGIWQIIVAAGEGAKAALSAYQYLTKQS